LLGAEFTWVYAHTFGSRKGQGMPAATEAKTAPAQTGAAGRPGVSEAVPAHSSRA